MKKKLLLLLMLVESIALARTVLTGVPALRLPRGYGHAVLDYENVDDERCRSLRLWAGVDDYTAHEAYGTKNGREKVPLAALLFNSSDFYFSESFVNQMSTANGNILTMLAKISPRFGIDRTTCTFGMDAKLWSDCDNTCYGGIRAMLPYSTTQVRMDDCCNLSDIDSTDDIKGRLYMCDEETISTNGDPVMPDELTAQNVCVYRMDLVAALNQDIDHIPLLAMNPDAAAGPTLEIGNTDISDQGTLNSAPPGTPVVYLSNPVHFLVSTDGEIPARPWSVYVPGAANNPIGYDPLTPGGLPFLNADGSNATTTGQRLRVLSNTDYTPLLNDPVKLRQLFLVPAVVPETIPSVATPTEALIGSGARTVQILLNNVINDTSFSLSEFLQNPDVNLNFASQRIYDLGDFTVHAYMGRNWWDHCVRAEGWIGLTIPTNKQIKNPHNVLEVSSGNNGHVEFHFGGETQWNPQDWFNLRAQAQVNAVANKVEPINATFAGASVINLGPVTEAKVSWAYFNAEIHGTFLLPCAYTSGIDFAYELYVKGKDHISFYPTTATDYAGITGKLDGDLAAQRSNRIGHTIRTEMFFTFNNINITAGFSHVIGGKNIPVGTNMFLMMTLAY